METIDPVHRIRAITSYRHDDTSSISVSLTLKTVFKAGPQRHTVTAVVQKGKKKDYSNSRTRKFSKITIIFHYACSNPRVIGHKARVIEEAQIQI